MAIPRAPKEHINSKLGIKLFSPLIENTNDEIFKRTNEIISYKKPLNQERIKEYLNAIIKIKSGLRENYKKEYEFERNKYDLKGYFNCYKEYIDEIDKKGDFTYNFKDKFLNLEEDVLRKNIKQNIKEENIDGNNEKINYFGNLIDDINELKVKGYDISDYESNLGYAIEQKIKLMEKNNLPDFMIKEEENKLYKIKKRINFK